MTLHFDKSMTIRINDTWSNELGRLLNIVSRGKKDDRSRLIRELVEKEVALWADSPYIAAESEHFVLVSRTGDNFLRSVQTLHLNEQRERLPAQIEMKPERQLFYERKYKNEHSPIDLIRSHWLFNHFTAWEGNTRKKLLSTHSDTLGVTSKWADLRVNMPAGAVVTRETLVGLKDYVQRKTGYDTISDRTSDRGDIAIDIPTLNFSVGIVIDAELYSEEDGALGPKLLNYELRNRESARFPTRRIGGHENSISWTNDLYPDPFYPGVEYASTLEAIQLSFESFRERLREISKGQDEDEKKGPDSSTVGIRDGSLSEFVLPKRFLFGRLEWEMPYQGLEVCMTWKKPGEQA